MSALEFKPYVPDDAKVAEFTPKAVILGAMFGVIFGASTVYLALKAGLTVSASIPIAVVSISLLKKLGGSTIFPDVQLDVAPVKGNAVFFSYDRAHPVTRTLHGGAPVVEGEKWVATKWLREGRFE